MRHYNFKDKSLQVENKMLLQVYKFIAPCYREV
jgi:hypothetical protein